MRYLELETTDVALNLAIEDLLFSHADAEALFILWRNDPAVVCGAYQNIYQEVSLPEAESMNISLARRLTGGGTVYHDSGNINYSFILSDQAFGIDYEQILQRVCRALGRLGINASIDQGSDLIWEGAKISGNAQKKSRRRLLHHGTLLYDCDLTILGRLANGHRPYYKSKATASRPRPVANLSEAFGENTSCRSFMTAFRQAIAEEEDLKAWQLPQELFEEAKSLAKRRYRSWDWTFAKSPDFSFARSFTERPLRTLRYEVSKGRIQSLQMEPALPRVQQAAKGLPLSYDRVDTLCRDLGQGLLRSTDFF